RCERGPPDGCPGVLENSDHRITEGAGASAARELLAQSGEGLIAGERAGIGRRLAGVGAARRRGLGADRGRGCGLGVCRDRLGDLLLVLLPVMLSGGVLLLPLLALGLEALEPLVGLRVEALRVLVVPVLVVLLEHAVKRGVEELL